MVKRPKRPPDRNQLGKLIVDLAAGEAKDQVPKEDTAAIAFARLGGLKGGVARAAYLSGDERKRIAKKSLRKRAGNEIAKSTTEDRLMFCSPAKRIMPIEFNLPAAI